MSYSNRYGNRPIEYASKSAHTQIINDPDLKQFIKSCNFPKNGQEVYIDESSLYKVNFNNESTIKYIVTVDGGYDSVSTVKTYPSAIIAFFQFGALIFKVEDLESIDKQTFIFPEDMEKLKKMERLKLALPIRNITIDSEVDLIDSLRKAIYDFFMSKPRRIKESTSNFMETLQWLIYSDYLPTSSSEKTDVYTLSNCPKCSERNIVLYKNEMENDYKTKCPECGNAIYLTDVFRLHEAIDNELGAGGVLGYVTTLLEQMVILDLIRTIYYKNKSWLTETLFIKDGPLGFFGQTANMFRYVRNLLNFLDNQGLTINLVGIEKSGIFVEHAHEIESRLEPGTVLLLSNNYIYGNILPSKDNNDPYASTSYYSGKMIYKTQSEQMYVITVPTTTSEVYLNPLKEYYMNLDNILINLPKLKCDMYDNALFPVALANKLVSLSSHPSSTILEQFFKEMVKK